MKINVEKLNLARARCPQAVLNLRHAHLAGAHLAGASLEWAHLAGASLEWANLAGANLAGANLAGANLAGANLAGANLADVNLADAHLEGAIIEGAFLEGANISGCTILSPVDWLQENFVTDARGYIVYKAIGETDFPMPATWNIAPGAVLRETVNANRANNCGCGVNFGTRGYCKKKYPNSTLWECLIEWAWLPGVVVPYNTDGKARCERLRLLQVVE